MITRLRVLKRRLRKVTLSPPRRFHSRNTTRSLADTRIVINWVGMRNRFRRIAIIQATMTTSLRPGICRRTLPRKRTTIGKRRKRVKRTMTNHVTTKDGRRKRRETRMRLNITIKISTRNSMRRTKRNYRNKVSSISSFLFIQVNYL